MAYLKNSWYVAAWSDEVGNALLAGTVLGEPIVLGRQSNGVAFALADRCAHRFAPLSMGRMVDDHVECAYHGLRYDGTGACRFNPHGNGMIPPRAVVRS